MFTLGREAVLAAIEELEQTKAAHYGVECPKCRHRVKVPVKDLKRAQPK